MSQDGSIRSFTQHAACLGQQRPNSPVPTPLINKGNLASAYNLFRLFGIDPSAWRDSSFANREAGRDFRLANAELTRVDKGSANKHLNMVVLVLILWGTLAWWLALVQGITKTEAGSHELKVEALKKAPVELSNRIESNYAHRHTFTDGLGAFIAQEQERFNPAFGCARADVKYDVHIDQGATRSQVVNCDRSRRLSADESVLGQISLPSQAAVPAISNRTTFETAESSDILAFNNGEGQESSPVRASCRTVSKYPQTQRPRPQITFINR
jgi:hypothetical protein